MKVNQYFVITFITGCLYAGTAKPPIGKHLRGTPCGEGNNNKLYNTGTTPITHKMKIEH